MLRLLRWKLLLIAFTGLLRWLRFHIAAIAAVCQRAE